MERAQPGSTGYPKEGEPFRPTFHPNRIDQISKQKGNKRIFLDSMGDLFSDGVQPDWLSAMIDAVRQKPEHVFLALTKWTENLGFCDGFEIPRNLWIRTSVTSQDDVHRIQELKYALPKFHKFVSIEPLHGPIDADLTCIEWRIIIGAETGNRRRKIKPRPERIEDLRKRAEKLGIPVFLKNNLKSNLLPGSEHLQPFPSAMERGGR